MKTTRRSFLETASAATLSALAAGYPRLGRRAGSARARRPADRLIVLWMAGGMAHTETFDPKRYTPFERGREAEAGAQHVSRDRHRRRWHQVLEGPGADRRR